MSRFGFVEHPESVTLVVVDGEEIVLVRQSRPGAPGLRTLELPAGTCEAGESPAETARRELAEECGLEVSALKLLGSFYIAPSYSSELTHVFEATGLAPAMATADEDEDITVERLPVDRVLGALSDAGSIAAFAIWQAAQAAGASQSST